mmetsp:Transcript_35856/g.71068  ORF Transcript_35856/g.71068 Transcript_35856/m.71068 type:complete len:196 (+) Transcript_35856:12-599(+)
MSVSSNSSNSIRAAARPTAIMSKFRALLPLAGRTFAQQALKVPPTPAISRSRLIGAPMGTCVNTFWYRSKMTFAKTHEWLRAESDGHAVLGISDFAQGALGEVVYCDLPSEGSTVNAKETICTLESVKAVGEVYAPADCEVVEVNGALNDEPSLVNSSPLEDGWIVKVKVTGEAADMMDEAAYAKHVQEEGGGES